MKIAIVGAGISGLTAAHLLAPRHRIEVFEAAGYAGGHTNTVRVDTGDATHWIDTGFIVCNDRNYPQFNRLLARLGVATQPSHMGFSVSTPGGSFEYAGTPRGLFCQPGNLARGTFWRMIADLVRFNRSLGELLRRRESAAQWRLSLGEFVDQGGYSRAFVERLIVPQASAVWSADPTQMWTFPVRFLAEFFANHGMLGFRDRPRWATVRGGSVRYVEALTAPWRERLHLSTPVRSVTRGPHGVRLSVEHHGRRQEAEFDHVLLATHSDQALEMLADASPREREILEAIPYQANEAVLHSDSRLLPRRTAARQAWNFHLLPEPKPVSTVTYWMNRLQRLDADRDFCVTLNRSEDIDPSTVIRRIDYSHPIFTSAGVDAQARHGEISSLQRRTHFAGAYWGWGFHEDGVRSALRACRPFEVGA